MELRNAIILNHGKTPYDPVKAHEYYLRTRELRGRRGRRTSQSPRSIRRVSPSSVTRSPTFTVRLLDGRKVKLTREQLVEQQVYAAKRVRDIKKRLAELSTRLRKMTGEAKEKQAKTKRESKKAPTAAEKSKAARESKQYRKKHETELATKRKTGGSKKSTKPKSKADPVSNLEKRIGEIENRLVVAVARQRALASATRSS